MCMVIVYATSNEAIAVYECKWNGRLWQDMKAIMAGEQIYESQPLIEKAAHKLQIDENISQQM